MGPQTRVTQDDIFRSGGGTAVKSYPFNAESLYAQLEVRADAQPVCALRGGGELIFFAVARQSEADGDDPDEAGEAHQRNQEE